jgi:hypothetical protein
MTVLKGGKLVKCPYRSANVYSWVCETACEYFEKKICRYGIRRTKQKDPKSNGKVKV